MEPAALDSEADDVHMNAASAEISSRPAVHGSTVRVRFVLKEQCTFGHSFLLVGDDPALGLWEPTNAIALDWSEGHDWAVEKDLPANRLVEFKFLLLDSLGKFHWQNGANRSVQTGETAKTLVVYEDWVDHKKQKVAEEGDASVGVVETVVADNGNARNGVVSVNELQVDDNPEIKEDESSSEDDENSTVAVIASLQGESVKAHEDDADQTELMMNEQKTQDERHDEVDTEPPNGSPTKCADDDYAEGTDDASILTKDGVPVKNGWTGGFERELLWGWKAMQQLLMSLGFKMDAT